MPSRIGKENSKQVGILSWVFFDRFREALESVSSILSTNCADENFVTMVRSRLIEVEAFKNYNLPRWVSYRQY